MNRNRKTRFVLAVGSLAACFAAGCRAPGMPGPPEVRPDQVMDFNVLYKQNCASCHGEQGHGGIAISMANPVYIAIAGEQTIARAIDEGGPGELMPAFGKKHGGFLTDAQVNALAQGIVTRWGRADALAGATAPPDAATLAGDPAAGKAAFATYCARCHRDTNDRNAKPRNAGPVTDPDFLALISDQNIRSTILAGKPDEGMPDWRHLGTQPMSDRDITDVVAWLSSLRDAAHAATPTQTSIAPQGEQKR